VSVADIGARTGLAASTVSLALRGAYGVSAHTRHRVLSAAAELGYDMTRVSSGPVRRSRAPLYPMPAPVAAPAPVETATPVRLRAGIVYPAGTGIAAVEANPDQSRVLDGVQAGAGSMHMDLVFIPCVDEDLDPLVRLVAESAGSGKQGALDGLIMIALGPRSKALHRALRQPAPVVICNRYDHSLPCSWVSVHHEHMAAELTRHLLAQGYRTAVFVARDVTPSSRPLQRLTGIRTAVEAARVAGAPVELREYLERPMDGRLFDDLAAALQDAGGAGQDGAPVAVITHADMDALAVRHGLKARGLQAPRDYGLAGFDDLVDTLTGTSNGITTVTYAHEAIGALALRVLRDLREDPLRERQQIFVKARVAARQSTARHPAAPLG
jgi:LacI family transcriptional regulator